MILLDDYMVVWDQGIPPTCKKKRSGLGIYIIYSSLPTIQPLQTL